MMRREYIIMFYTGKGYLVGSEHDNDNEIVHIYNNIETQAYKDYASMHTYTVIIRKSDN